VSRGCHDAGAQSRRGELGANPLGEIAHVWRVLRLRGNGLKAQEVPEIVQQRLRMLIVVRECFSGHSDESPMRYRSERLYAKTSRNSCVRAAAQRQTTQVAAQSHH
jgi:hypothetical protein